MSWASTFRRTAPLEVPPADRRWARAGFVAFAMLGGAAIFVVGSPYFELSTLKDDPSTAVRSPP